MNNKRNFRNQLKKLIFLQAVTELQTRAATEQQYAALCQAKNSICFQLKH